MTTKSITINGEEYNSALERRAKANDKSLVIGETGLVLYENQDQTIKIVATGKAGQGGFAKTYKGKLHHRKGNFAKWEQGEDIAIKEFFIHYSADNHIFSERECDGITVNLRENEILEEQKAIIQEERDRQQTNKTQDKSYVSNIERLKKIKERFEKEPSIASTVEDTEGRKHNNVVEVKHSFAANGTLYYAMEWIDGKTLFQYLKDIRRGPFLSFCEFWRFFRDLCDGLSCVHNKGIIHRDLSPNNIMVELNSNNEIQRFVIIDFGNSKDYSNDNDFTIAGDGTVARTPNFTDPEINKLDHAHLNYTPATDIYSLGAIVYYSLTGIIPEGSSFTERISDVRLRNVINKAMHTNKEERYSNVEEFISACDEIAKAEQILLRRTWETNTLLNISPKITLGKLNECGPITIDVPLDEKTLSSKIIDGLKWQDILGDGNNYDYIVSNIKFKRIQLKAILLDNKYDLVIIH